MPIQKPLKAGWPQGTPEITGVVSIIRPAWSERVYFSLRLCIVHFNISDHAFFISRHSFMDIHKLNSSGLLSLLRIPTPPIEIPRIIRYPTVLSYNLAYPSNGTRSTTLLGTTPKNQINLAQMLLLKQDYLI